MMIGHTLAMVVAIAQYQDRSFTGQASGKVVDYKGGQQLPLPVGKNCSI